MAEVKPAKEPQWKPEHIMNFIKKLYSPTDKNRMYARLMTHMSVDIWMTYELMEVAIKKIISDAAFPGQFRLLETFRDTTSSEVAKGLDIKGKDADNFCSFQGIKLDSETKHLLKHVNRPDGTFTFELEKDGNTQKMVLFYEGDDHRKDDNKTLTEKCKNSHKMYQYFAQSQSYNADMAGCAIFANMYYGYTEVIDFLNDMYKAHMFAFAVIAHYNYESEKSKTSLHQLLDLEKDMKYDFVIGINMDLKESRKFNINFFNARTRLIREIIDVDISIPADFQKNADINKTTFTIGRVIISIIGIPRIQNLNWDVAQAKGCFVYPKDVATKVFFDERRFSASTEIFKNLIIAQKNSNYMTVNFRDEMSDVTTVLRTHNKKKASPNSRKYCQLTDTNGFFVIALPLAYYTISQFEGVNDLLQYKYSSSQKIFKPLLLNFKDGLIHHKTDHIKVDMFDDSKRTSLFSEICKSVETTPDIDEEFKTFLNEVCRWKATGESSNPAIFFRSMRIRSLQNAIDFAFEFSNQQNPTHAKILSTYPIGTQILLKQCLQNLNESGMAYLSRKHDNASDGSSGTDEDEDDDDDEDEGIVSKIEDFIMNREKATFWNAELISQASSATFGVLGQELCSKLLEVYKKQIKWRVCYENLDNIDELPDPQKMEDVSNVYRPFTISWIDIQDPRKKYKFEEMILEPIINKEFNCDEVSISEKVRDQENVEVIMPWGDNFIKFTMAFSNKQQKMTSDVQGKVSWFGRLFRTT
jgi:hypothetical protein